MEVRSVIILLYSFLFLFGLVANVGVLSAVFRNRLDNLFFFSSAIKQRTINKLNFSLLFPFREKHN